MRARWDLQGLGYDDCTRHEARLVKARPPDLGFLVDRADKDFGVLDLNIGRQIGAQT